MVESLDLSLIEMNRWLKLEGGRKGTLENHKVTTKMEEGQQELSEWKDFTLIPDGSFGVVGMYPN